MLVCCNRDMDEAEKQMVGRFIEKMRQVDDHEKETRRMQDDAAEFAYLSTLKYPDFIDHIKELEKTLDGHNIDTPLGIIRFIMLCRHAKTDEQLKAICSMKCERRSNETTRAWMQRFEELVVKKKQKEGWT
jgi:hypothetical protein